MAVALTFQVRSFRGMLLRYWNAFSTTLVGDIIATAIAITGIAVLFLACSFLLIWVARVGAAILHHIG